MEFIEIDIDDDINKTIRKSNHNFKELQKGALSIWHDFQCVDLTNGDRKHFQNWIVNLFLEENDMKVWITKYALTDGIIEADAESCSSNIASVNWDNGTRCMNLHWSECYLSKESAIKKAEEMRQKKIESLKKQIKKLDEMRFE